MQNGVSHGGVWQAQCVPVKCGDVHGGSWGGVTAVDAGAGCGPRDQGRHQFSAGGQCVRRHVRRDVAQFVASGVSPGEQT